jgi:hypothetical protein
MICRDCHEKVVCDPRKHPIYLSASCTACGKKVTCYMCPKVPPRLVLTGPPYDRDTHVKMYRFTKGITYKRGKVI